MYLNEQQEQPNEYLNKIDLMSKDLIQSLEQEILNSMKKL